MHRPGKGYPLREAAAAGQLLVVRCNLCHRTVHYLAADLVKVLDPEYDARLPPFECGRCGKDDYMRVTLRLPSSGDYGSLMVRRPGPVRRTRTWVNVKLGDD